MHNQPHRPVTLGTHRRLKSSGGLTNTHWRIIIWAALTGALIAISCSSWSSGFAHVVGREGKDLQLYQAELNALRAGGNYYHIAAQELVTRGYPTKSILNWRTPVHLWIMTLVNDQVIKLAWSIVVLWTWRLLLPAWYQAGRVASVALGTIAMLGASLIIFIEQGLLMSEVWSGLAIGLSLACYAGERRRVAVLAGIAALFFRELAAPYVVLSMILAARERRWSEVLAWSSGVVLYAMFYVWHVQQILPLIPATGHAHSQSWIAWGGAAFVISLVQMNLWLLMLPQWCSALALSALAWTWANARTEPAVRLAWFGLLYVVVFAVVGLPFNQYWGAMLAPGFALTLGWLPATVMKLDLTANDSESSAI